MLTRREIERRMRQRQEWLERKYDEGELDEDRLDMRIVDEVRQDLGCEEFHRQRDEG